MDGQRPRDAESALEFQGCRLASAQCADAKAAFNLSASEGVELNPADFANFSVIPPAVFFCTRWEKRMVEAGSPIPERLI